MAKKPTKSKSPKRKSVEAAKARVINENAAPPENGAGEQSEYDRIAGRIGAAVDELQRAFEEAAGLDEMRVEFGRAGNSVPAKFEHRIYKLSQASMVFTVIPVETPGKSRTAPKTATAAA